MQSIEVRELEQLGDRIDALFKQLPEEKRRLHERLARTARGLVTREISARLSDGGGKIAGWQKEYVGSGGGYAAVREQAPAEAQKSIARFADALTSKLEGR